MKTLRYTFAALLFAFFAAAVPTLAQTAAPAGAGAGKFALINTVAFGDEKAGITRYVSAEKSLETEFQPRVTALKTANDKIAAINKELQTFRDQIAKGVPVNEATVIAKQAEGEKLARQLKVDQEQASADYERRKAAVMGPMFQDIGKAIQDFSKQKGYTMVFDPSKDQNGMLLWADIAATDVTAEFVKFYNARPAGTAAAK